MERISEVVVVGGGPAGSTCAAELVRLGIPVIVWDKAVFPRDKVCAGWITPQIVDALELDIAEYARQHVCQPVFAFRVGLIGGGTVEITYDRPMSYGIRRCEFDTYLLRRCGAGLKLGEPVRRLQRTPRGWTINDHLQARLIVGAGGHFCPVARTLRNGRDRAAPVVPAQEVEFRMTADQAGLCRIAPECPELYFCPDFRGYAWCFRKGDYLNIGLGRIEESRLSAHLESFVDFLRRAGRIGFDLPARFKGHAYRLLTPPFADAVDDAALLVGDALGLAYPQSGEGIRPAVESGLLAARAIAAAGGDYSADRLWHYVQWLEERFVRDRAVPDATSSTLDGSPAARQAAPSTLPHRKRPADRARADHGASDGHPLRRLRCWAGRLLLHNRWFVRRIVLERWFLHCHVPPIFGPRHGAPDGPSRGLSPTAGVPAHSPQLQETPCGDASVPAGASAPPGDRH